MVRETKEVIRLNRKCDSTQVFVKNSLTYCIDTCRPVTMCGEVEVPEEHLDVSYNFLLLSSNGEKKNKQIFRFAVCATPRGKIVVKIPKRSEV